MRSGTFSTARPHLAPGRDRRQHDNRGQPTKPDLSFLIVKEGRLLPCATRPSLTALRGGLAPSAKFSADTECHTTHYLNVDRVAKIDGDVY